MVWVYAISSVERNYIYVGITFDVDKRFDRHNKGHERTTKPYAPFKLIFTEEYKSREEARQREKYWKSGIGKERLKRIRDNF
jgi:putative endonuclease